MTARLRSLTLALAALLLLSACGAPAVSTAPSASSAPSEAAAAPSPSPSPTAAPSPTAEPTAPPAATVAGATDAAAGVEVAIGDNSFAPAALTVPVGTTVVWTNGGQRPHTVTADDGSFKSDTLNNGGTFSRTFDQPGTFKYYCEFHGGPGGANMAATITVSAGDAAVAPTPTFEGVTDGEPTVAAIAATGNAGWRDQVLRGDALSLSVTDLAAPAAGQDYTAWLAGKESRLALGTLSFGSGAATLTYVAPGHDNLIGAYDRLFVTTGDEGNPEIVLAGGLPPQALVHIRHVLFSIGATPGKIGFAVGLRQETDELLRHAQFLKEAFDAGNLALEKVHAEHIVNLIGGAQAADFGDRNGDGKVQNPGDGFGLLPNGTQDGYIKGMSDHAKLAADSPDATDNVKLHAGHVQVAAENTRVRVQDMHDRAQRIQEAGGIAATQEDVLTMLALAQQTIQGVDANNDEQITPTPGEGGVLTAYQHAQLMAGITLTGDTAAFGALPPVAQPAAVAPTTIEIADNSFTPKTITVPVGTTIVWNDGGQKPHTVTADDGAFDSGKLANGQTYSQTFATAGTFAYFCSIHGGKGGTGMSGAIVVVDPGAAAPPPAAAPSDHGSGSAAAHSSTPPAAAAPPTPTAAPPAAPTAAPPAAAPGKVDVAIGDNTFGPKELSVPVGTTVVWTNGGQRPHTVTADDGSFKSDTLNNGGTFSRTFDQPGTFLYYCEFHGGPGGVGMTGVIKVGN